ncbi:ATP-dependent helicase HrpB [Marivivens sp.]|jgi:ATP-dependent helicase HrpB|uniref:ATP-dependent helicase HrpB n=1 Tax=Marivivens sp. TaxID=1978374 RepID=UPI00201F2C70|nr:ATP-dependent helicase HrpB [Marivivens sp.]MCL7406582.1 ATP-dependent helicase HrpB [Marivivens geojensis]
MTLPIDSALPDLIDALRVEGRAVLQAPPGAGKTTRVPLALLDAKVTDGKIIMLEPRRLAARAAAERLAEQLGEKTGQTVGYRMRGDSKAGSRVEVVTEGILTRMIQSDPELTGIGAIIFDEFHERSLNADLGLALTWEIRQALRDDLILVVMSATLDAEPVARLLDNAPMITSEGRAYPVDLVYLERPLDKARRLEAATADLIVDAVAQTEGGVLVFLPGEGEIRRTEAALQGRLPKECDVRPLYGALPFAQQRAAIAPVSSGRKIVLSTSIAETSLTIEDIRVVVDAGRARRSRYDPSSGMARLVTERVSKAEATQRAGRAGRVAAGTCYRLWTKGEDGALQAFPPAEIEATDLAGLALEMALWGAADLPFLTPPPEGTLAEAQALLHQLGALDADGRITDHGRLIAAMPLHPRLAHMLAVAGKQAAPLAALLADRDPMIGGQTDLMLRLRAIRTGEGNVNRSVLDRIKVEAKRFAQMSEEKPRLSPAEMAALAYPDRIGLRRSGDAPRYILSGGKGAVMPDGDGLAGQRLIVATDLDGNPREAKIRQALAISESELRGLFADQIAWTDVCEWSKRDRRVKTRRVEMFGALPLDDRQWSEASEEAIARAMLDGVRDLGLRLDGAAARLCARVELVRTGGADLPAMDTDSLMAGLEDWLLPHLNGVRSADDWKRFNPHDALRGMMSWDQLQVLDQAAPSHFETPLGRKIPIDYDGEHPQITLRLQEMFGVTRHPTVGKTPLRVTLLSPGQKPVQVTMDIPGFWANSYADVRKDMRGQYPKHPWPEDPTTADPTLRAKPRAR